MENESQLECWPEGVSDGLRLPCSLCDQRPYFDYTVTDEVWKKVTPKEYRLGVLCLSCFDLLAHRQEVNIAQDILQVQFTGIGKTVCFSPTFIHQYDPPWKNGE